MASKFQEHAALLKRVRGLQNSIGIIVTLVDCCGIRYVAAASHSSGYYSCFMYSQLPFLLYIRQGCCSLCARVCHKGHDVGYSRKSSFFCDCGAEVAIAIAEGRTPCKCLTTSGRRREVSMSFTCLIPLLLNDISKLQPQFQQPITTH